MRSSILVAMVFFVSIAAGAPGDATGVAASAPQAGFSRRLVAETVSATLPRARETSAVFAAVKVTAEVGADE